MNPYERSKLLRGERATQLRNLAGNLIADADMLPTKSELKAEIEEIYPGDGNAKLRTTLYEKLVKVAEGAQDRRNRFALRGIVDELVIQVETKLTDDDRLMPKQEEPAPEDIEETIAKAGDPYANRIGGELDRARDKERDEAREILRRAGR